LGRGRNRRRRPHSLLGFGTKLTYSVTNRRRKKDSDDESGDVTYINKRNKVFNKKVARYFDKYTKE
jgi:pre-mRNA-splicing factor SYF2